jgi:hypothetical protein
MKKFKLKNIIELEKKKKTEDRLDDGTSFKKAKGLMQKWEWILNRENAGWITDLPGSD